MRQTLDPFEKQIMAMKHISVAEKVELIKRHRQSMKENLEAIDKIKRIMSVEINKNVSKTLRIFEGKMNKKLEKMIKRFFS